MVQFSKITLKSLWGTQWYFKPKFQFSLHLDKKWPIAMISKFLASIGLFYHFSFESGVGDTIGIGPESRYQSAWYRYRNRILHIPGSQYRSRYRIFLFLGTPLNKLGHFFIFYLITFAKSWYQYRNRYRILPIPGSRIGIGIAQTFNLVSES